MQLTNIPSYKIEKESYVYIKASDTLNVLIRQIKSNPSVKAAVITDEQGRFLKLLYPSDILAFVFPYVSFCSDYGFKSAAEKILNNPVGDFSGDPFAVSEDEGLYPLIRRALERKSEDLPVVDKHNRVVKVENINTLLLKLFNRAAAFILGE